MEIRKVPQQNISTYAENKKALYATDKDGRYTRVASSGWEVEEAATKLALAELEQQATRARKKVEAGRAASLYYHMFARRMDLQTLAQATGFFKWRVKRHMRPEVFANLSPKIIARYTEALGISCQELCSLPPEDEHGR